MRLSALAMLGQYDALAIVGDPDERTRTHNVASDPLLDPVIRGAVERARRTPETAQVRGPLALADGRTASVMLIAPVIANERTRAVLLAARVLRSFSTADAIAAHSITDLLAVDLVRQLAARREALERKQALALYELGRTALFSDDLSETLQSAVTVLANMLDHDVARLWLMRSAEALQLWAAYPQDAPPLGVLRARDHGVLSEVLVQRRVVRVDDVAPDPWVPPEARALLVAPLLDRSRPLGLLVLGRSSQPYSAEDEELAGVIGHFMARLVLVVTRQADQSAEGASSRAFAEWHEERELLRS